VSSVKIQGAIPDSVMPGLSPPLTASGHRNPPGVSPAAQDCGCVSEDHESACWYDEVVQLQDLPNPRQASATFLVRIGLEADRFQEWVSKLFGIDDQDWDNVITAYLAYNSGKVNSDDAFTDMISLGLTQEAARWVSTNVKMYGHREPADWAGFKVHAELMRELCGERHAL